MISQFMQPKVARPTRLDDGIVAVEGFKLMQLQRVPELFGDATGSVVETTAAVDEDHVWLRPVEAGMNCSAELVYEKWHPADVVTLESSAQHLQMRLALRQDRHPVYPHAFSASENKVLLPTAPVARLILRPF